MEHKHNIKPKGGQGRRERKQHGPSSTVLLTQESQNPRSANKLWHTITLSKSRQNYFPIYPNNIQCFGRERCFQTNHLIRSHDDISYSTFVTFFLLWSPSSLMVLREPSPSFSVLLAAERLLTSNSINITAALLYTAPVKTSRSHTVYV